MLGPSLALFLVLGSCATLVRVSEANAFLQSNSELYIMSEKEVRMSFLAEVQGALGNAATGRLAQLESKLQPMYAALPKNEHGRLGHTTARYALHRLFVQRHGWFIKGLEPSGLASNTSSPTGILKDRVPSYVLGLFEERMHGRGLGLHELAVLASTLEHLVHDEAAGRLLVAYNAHDFLPTGWLEEHQVELVIETYIMMLMFGSDLGIDLTSLSMEELMEKHQLMESAYDGWEATKQFAREMRHSVVFAERYRANPFVSGRLNYTTVERVVEQFGEHFGQFQNEECVSLKDNLLAIEDVFGSGRARLSDFYKLALNGMPQLQESVEYLRHNGVLDESDSKNLRVIIPNYVSSQSNCLASSSFYSICCIDECDQLLGHIEQKISAPTADPQRITQLVANLPSSTVEAPRNLPNSVLERLEEVAAFHQGVVPLHGRLFAQWMHHAFPRECPYPHVSGSATPLTPEEWMQETGQDIAFSADQMKQYLEVAESFDVLVEDEMQPLPWTPDEELVVMRQSLPTATPGYGLWDVVRLAMFVAVLGSIATVMAHNIKSAIESLQHSDSDKYLV